MFRLVSIPYRYTKNFDYPHKLRLFQLCFNPLQVHKKPQPPRCSSFSISSSFQSPIGTQKTQEAYNVYTLIFQFQSPIGTQKTIHIFKPISTQFCVSIPYRYTKNVFAFCANSSSGKRFNPLQVHKKHTLLVEIYRCTLQFQSPIGTQKTNSLRDLVKMLRVVSIPYRYTKNISVVYPERLISCGFNPLQVHKKLQAANLLMDANIRFNPLQVHKKQSIQYKTQESKSCFNPLQVHKKPIKIPPLKKIFKSFNPLQVHKKPSKQ